MTGLDDDTAFMQRALALAERAGQAGEVPVGCVIVRDGKIIGEGCNSPITQCDPTAHAEIVAIRHAAESLGNYRLADCTLYVTIEPCTMCLGAMIHARIKRLVFGASEPKSGVIVSNNPLEGVAYFNHQMQYEGGLLAESGSTLMQNFFRQKRMKTATE